MRRAGRWVAEWLAEQTIKAVWFGFDGALLLWTWVTDPLVRLEDRIRRR